MKKSHDVLRMLDSLCCMFWENAESGNVDSDTATNIAELMSWMTQIVMDLRAKEEGKAVV